MTDQFDTIAALASAPGAAGVAVVRISGPATRKIAEIFFDSAWPPVNNPRRLVYGRIIDPESNEILDHALAVFMPNPHSFTGEDTLEFQTHGSPLLVKRLLGALFRHGVRAAEAGEFTKRAFLNGKIDLTQAEALAELISASSVQALKIAEEQFQGKLSSLLERVGEPLRDILAEIEAYIDFPEEDITPDSLSNIQQKLAVSIKSLSNLKATYDYGEIVREGYRVLLCGRPNAGKSSLLNALLKQERAIVSDISGTTRDLIEESANFEDYKFVFCDSAGIRESQDPIEKMGVELALNRIAWADLLLLVVDISDSQTEIDQIIEILKTRNKKIWLIVNKIDLHPDKIGNLTCDSQACRQVIYLSAENKEGIDRLIKSLVEEIEARIEYSSESSQVIICERQKSCLENAVLALTATLNCFRSDQPLEIIAAELRNGLSALDELIGKTSVEDLLGRIFSKFCIGK